MINRRDIREGMVVRSADGHKLGKVFAIGDQAFQIEKGLFFKHDYVADYGAVADIRDDEIILTHQRDALREISEREPRAQPAQTFAQPPPAGTPGAMPRASNAPPGATTGRGEMRVPLAEEEVDVAKVQKSAGEAAVHKRVVEEEKTFTVPVTREEIEVERVPAERAARGSEPARFQDETVRVPLTEEEVEIRKRPVVREELRVHKRPVTDERRVATDVRHEEADVRSDADARRPPLSDQERAERYAGPSEDVNLSGDEEDTGYTAPSDYEEPKRH